MLIGQASPMKHCLEVKQRNFGQRDFMGVTKLSRLIRFVNESSSRSSSTNLFLPVFVKQWERPMSWEPSHYKMRSALNPSISGPCNRNWFDAKRQFRDLLIDGLSSPSLSSIVKMFRRRTYEKILILICTDNSYNNDSTHQNCMISSLLKQ
uniref:Uncharacterized protein n=1 Tax=Romanomermis culicivorax TaxID=13658 RepID=A0A915LA44_ROMCU